MKTDVIINREALYALRELPSESVNCCVTSPPYYGLRDYGLDMQIGREDTPEQYIDRLVEVFRELRRVLKDDGTFWLNIADTYCGTGMKAGCKQKDLIGIPWLLAFALRADGWYLRSDIIWLKENPMPESCRDRPSRCYEHIFLLTKSKKYYYDAAAIAEPIAPGTAARYRQGRSAGHKYAEEVPGQGKVQGINQPRSGGYYDDALMPTTRNKRDVWLINTVPYKGGHFAAYPPKLAETCILAGCPAGGVVLDPFFGSGTTGLAAKSLDRRYIGIELNAEYCALAGARIGGGNTLKPRDKITQKMTRDGAIAENQTTGDTERISKRTQDADFQKSPEQQAAQDAAQLQGAASPTSPLPHVPGAAPKADTGKTERVMEHIDAAHTRKASKKAVRKAQAEATAGTKSSRLQFTDEERAAPELEKYIKKSDKAADRLDKAKAAIPKEKKLTKERTFDEATGKGKTRLHFEEKDKPPGFKDKHTPLSRPAQEAGILVHNKIHSVEKDNSGVEGAHKSEEAAERGAKYGVRKIKQGYRSHKLKPYREAAKAEKAAFKANVDFQYHKTLHENPQLTSNPISRFWQKQQIKKQYAKEARNTAKGIKGAAERTRKAAAKAAEKTKQTAAFVARHPAGVAIAVGALLLFIMLLSGLSSCGAMFSGTLNGVLGTSYTSEDSDLVEVENAYAGLESGLQNEIDAIESTHPGYDEYRYDLANIGHNPHELASYLTAKYQSYTRAEVQSELQRIFNQQYRLTLTEEVEIRYREEERTDTWTDEDGNEHTDTYTVQVPYEYYILNVKLTNTPLSTIAENNLTPEQLEMYRVYLQTSGNKPLIFGGGSPDTSASEDLSGVDFVNGTRPGNTAIVDLAKQQVGNVGGYPYWSWYGFNSRVEWCACFVSWCYGQMGLSEPRFAACQSQGIPWFTSHGQWGARGYENIAPGDAIFFDWDLDGSADHVGLVIGRDESRVYTVEGNSGDACKIKSYPLDYACIKGYGLMNWN